MAHGENECYDQPNLGHPPNPRRVFPWLLLQLYLLPHLTLPCAAYIPRTCPRCLHSYRSVLRSPPTRPAKSSSSAMTAVCSTPISVLSPSPWGLPPTARG